MLNEYSDLPTELIRSLINKIKLFCKELKFQRLFFWESGQDTSQTNFFGGHRDKATDKNIQKNRWPGVVPQSINFIKLNNINRLSCYDVKTRLVDLGKSCWMKQNIEKYVMSIRF